MFDIYTVFETYSLVNPTTTIITPMLRCFCSLTDWDHCKVETSENKLQYKLVCWLIIASMMPVAKYKRRSTWSQLKLRKLVLCLNCRLEDLFEKIVLETTAERITPLVVNPGRILLTSARIYFQPFNNVEPVKINRFNYECTSCFMSWMLALIVLF